MTVLPWRAALLVCGSVLAGCAERASSADEVRDTFRAFEAALRADDEGRLLDLVTRESLPALEQIPPGAARARGALVVEAVAPRSRSCYEVAVREAGVDGGGTFVMVHEAGAWRVDLVESAAATHGTVKAPPRIEPAGLSAQQIDGIRTNQRARLQ